MQFYSDKIIPRKMILLDIVSYIWTYIASALNGNNVCMFVLFWYLFHPNGLLLSLFLFRMQYRHVHGIEFSEGCDIESVEVPDTNLSYDMVMIWQHSGKTLTLYIHAMTMEYLFRSMSETS